MSIAKVPGTRDAQVSPTTDRSVALQTAEPGWRTLYIAGAVAALVAVILFRRNSSVELMEIGRLGIIRGVPAEWPRSATEWFSLLQHNALVGLILLNVVDVINYCLVGLIFLALYGALGRTSKSAMVIATACALVGIGIYLASNQALAMLSLSKQYAAATTDAQRSMLLAAGEALLAIERPGVVYQGTGVTTSFFLVVTAGLIASVVMLRSSVFGKATAIVGIVANGIRLLGFVTLLLTPTIYSLAIPISAPFRVAWYVMIALTLFRLAKRGPREQGTPGD
jgi:hypothetical protein